MPTPGVLAKECAAITKQFEGVRGQREQQVGLRDGRDITYGNAPSSLIQI
jgi:hypothetical protein